MITKRLFVCWVGFWLGFVASAQSNGVYRELWPNLTTALGNTLTALTNTTYNPNWPDHPDPTQTKVYSKFETDTNTGMNNYGQRVRAYPLPPSTGNYTFWIASDDSSVLLLSTDENPANLRQIAAEPGWTSSENWTQDASQQSAPITLKAGQRYLIEALMQQGGGGDNLAVGWQLPNGTLERPIPGNRLGLDSAPVIVGQPTNLTVVEGAAAAFTVLLSNFVPPAAQWQLGTSNLPGANGLTLTLPAVPLAANGTTYRCVLSNAFGATNSASATLTGRGIRPRRSWSPPTTPR